MLILILIFGLGFHLNATTLIGSDLRHSTKDSMFNVKQFSHLIMIGIEEQKNQSISSSMACIHHLIIDFQAYYNGLPQEIIKYKIFKYVNGESVYENRNGYLWVW